MKKLLIALLFVAANAHAENILYSQNQAGGLVVLTNEQGSCAQGTRAYFATDANTVLARGCYGYNEPFVLGVDTDGISHQWPISQFIPTEFMKKAMKEAKGSV